MRHRWSERPVAVEPPVAELPDPDELEELLLEALVVPLPETTSPTCPESETIVPLCGAYSLVSPTASSSLCTVSWSLLTAALAEARLASRVAALTVALPEEPELSLSLEDEPLDCDCSRLLWDTVVLEVVVWVGSVVVALGVVVVWVGSVELVFGTVLGADSGFVSASIG